MQTKYWLMKSEPEVFSIDDLAKAKDQTTQWEGVRNYQARNFMRDEMNIGDKVIFYHSNSKPSGAAGICEVVREGYTDFTAFDLHDPHYDPNSKKDSPTWIMVDIKFVEKFSHFVPLADLKENVKLQKTQLLQKGNRLSVMPLTKEEFFAIVKMSK